MSGSGEGKREPGAGTPGSPPEAEGQGLPSLPPDPELEAALREAAEAVPEGELELDGGDAMLLEEPLEVGSSDAEVERLRGEITETHDRLLRLQADFENFRKRAARERQEALHYGPQNLVKDLLSVVDNLERAIDHARVSEGGNLESLLQGVELVHREFQVTLGNHQVVEIEAHGKPFNPALHEAMAQIPDASVDPNTVVEVLQKGYQLRDRLLRPARVVVTRVPEAGEGGEGETAD